MHCFSCEIHDISAYHFWCKYLIRMRFVVVRLDPNSKIKYFIALNVAWIWYYLKWNDEWRLYNIRARDSILSSDKISNRTNCRRFSPTSLLAKTLRINKIYAKIFSKFGSSELNLNCRSSYSFISTYNMNCGRS